MLQEAGSDCHGGGQGLPRNTALEQEAQQDGFRSVSLFALGSNLKEA